MQTLLIFVELVVAVALIVLVLLQRSEGGALGMSSGGGGGLGGLFSPRGAADTLTRSTAILAVLFFGICLALNLLALHGHSEKSILDVAPAKTAPASASKPAKPTAPVPAGPQVPKPQ